MKLQTAKKIVTAPAIWAWRAKTVRGKMFKGLLAFSLYYSPVSMMKSVSRPVEASPVASAPSEPSDTATIAYMRQGTQDVDAGEAKAIALSTETDYGTRKVRQTVVKDLSGNYLFQIDCNANDHTGTFYSKNGSQQVWCNVSIDGERSYVGFSSPTDPNATTVVVRFDSRESKAERESVNASRY